jgi:hypothetical protein
MTLRSDVRDCLIAAIASETGAEPTPAELNTLKPSDLGYLDGLAWLVTLDATADCLRGKGYVVEAPAHQKADELLGKAFIQSQLYLESLINS